MLLLSGTFLLVVGLLCFAIDRRASHFFHERVSKRMDRRIWRTTDWAKGAYWLAISATVLVVTELSIWFFGPTPMSHFWSQTAEAYLASLAMGSAILHTMKLVLGRRRPKDELELKLYGFRPFHFDLQYDSFPSGHALTIFCVAVIASAVAPMLAPLWFAIALYLAFTRALLNAHFLSDVFIGAGIGLLTARETVFYFFPSLFQPWF